MKLDNIYAKVEKLETVLPDWITGQTNVMLQKYRTKYGKKDCDRLIYHKKMKTLITYLIICIIFILGTVILFLGQLISSDNIIYIERPDYNEPVKSIPAQVCIKYKQTEINKSIKLKVGSKELSDSDKKAILKKYRTDLKNNILGTNKDLNHVKTPLNLIERDQRNGISLVWSSNKPEIINEKGEVDLINADKGESVKLGVIATLSGYSEKWSFLVKISPEITDIDYQETLRLRLMETIERMNKSSNSEFLNLPNTLKDDIKIEWSKGGNHLFYTLLMTIIISLLVTYFKRYDDIDKEIKAATESIIIDLPQFINKLVLLLNAGLVVSTALEKIADDYEQYNFDIKSDKKNIRAKRRYLYEELYEIEKRVKQTNTSITKELREFSQRSGVRELVRLSTIISDNINKGSTLAEKLEAEGELLWLSRKKRAEEKGRLAETKLTFPLVILLIVLIMVTIAPALMEM